MAVLGFHCCAQTSTAERGGYSLVTVPGLIIVVTFLVVEHKLQSTETSVVVEHRLSCLEACGIFLDQGSNLRPPAMAGGFFIVGPPGKSQCSRFLNWSGSIVLEGLQKSKSTKISNSILSLFLK